MEYDGAITINTKLDTTQFMADLEKLKKFAKEEASKISKLFSIARPTLTGAGTSSVAAIDAMSEAYRRQTELVERLHQKLQELYDSKRETTTFSDLQKQIDVTGRKLDEAAAKINKLIATTEGGESALSGTKRYVSLQYDIDALREAYERLIEKRQEMLENGTAYVDDAPLVARIEREEALQEDMLDRLDEKYDDLIEKRQEMYETSDNAVPTEEAALLDRITREEEKQSGMLERLNSGYEKLKDNLREIKEEGVNAHRQMADEGEKAHKRLNHHAKINFNTVMKYVFGIRSVFFAYRKLRQAAKEALGLMAQSDPQFNKVVSNFLTSVKQLKADIGTMIQPLVSTLAPVLTKILDKLHSAIIGFSQFIASLVGQDYIEVATVKTVDWADSLNDVGDAAKKTTKQLSALDKLNVISENGEDSANNAAKALALTKDTVEYTKKALNDDAWYVKLGKKLSGAFQTAIEWLQKQLDDPEKFLKKLGITVLAVKLGKMLLSGIAGSGFTAGISGLLPKAAVIALTAVIGYKIGNKIWKSLPEGMKEELADAVGGYVEAFEEGGLTGAIEHFGDEVIFTFTETWNEMSNAADDFVEAVMEGKLFPEDDTIPYRMPKPKVKEPTEEEKKALELQTKLYYTQLHARNQLRLQKFIEETAPIIAEFNFKFKEKWGVTPKEAFENIKNKLVNAWNNPANPIRTAMSALSEGFKDWWSGIWGLGTPKLSFSEKLAAISDRIRGAWDGKGNPVKTTLQNVKDGFSKMWNGIFDTNEEEKGRSLSDSITNGLNSVAKQAGSSGSALNNALLGVGRKISEGINKGTISVPVTFTGQATPTGNGKTQLPKINTTVTITLDGKTISNTVFDEAEKISKQTGTGAKAKLHYVLN